MIEYILNLLQAKLFPKKNEGFAYENLIDKRKRIKPECKVRDLVRTAGLKRTFSKGDTTNWSYKLYKVTEINYDTTRSYKIDNLLESYNQAFLKKTQLTMKENHSVMEELTIIT